MGDGRGGKPQGDDLLIPKPCLPYLRKLGLLLAQTSGESADNQEQDGGGCGEGDPHAYQVQLGEVGAVMFMGHRRMPDHQ